MTSQFDLFENAALLAWLPGETLFSLVSRHHYFWGYRLASQTCQRFFGHSRSGSQHDLPSRLSEFAARTGGHYGGAEEVARQRTILSYYGSFMDSNELQHFLTSMSGNSVAHLKLRLGILTSRFRSHHPLKACEACMASDRQEHGWAYWHIEHQYPGVWTCPIHKSILLESSLKATGVKRFLWHLPNARDVLRASVVAASGETLQSISSLAELITALVNHGHERPMALTDLHVHYRAELGKRGLITSGGNIRMPAIAHAYLDHVRRFRDVWEFEALPATYDEAVTQLGRLLRPPRGGTHPLRHLVLIHWLFGSADAFLSSVNENRTTGELSTSPPGQLVPSPRHSIDDPRRARVIEMISQKCSYRKAAAEVGIDVQTAMAWASQVGLSGSRRPKILAGSVRELAIAQLTAGEDKVVVAGAAGVSVVTITKLLFSEVGLHSAWTTARQNIARDAAQNKWLMALQDYPGLGIKMLRVLQPDVYAWLYRNERAWLDANKPQPLSNTRGADVPRVAWDERDVNFSSMVRQVALDLDKPDRKHPIKLWEIMQAIPALKAKTSALNRLPLTQNAIADVLQGKGSRQLGEDLFG
jgi:hypothetical protein